MHSKKDTTGQICSFHWFISPCILIKKKGRHLETLMYAGCRILLQQLKAVLKLNNDSEDSLLMLINDVPEINGRLS